MQYFNHFEYFGKVSLMVIHWNYIPVSLSKGSSVKLSQIYAEGGQYKGFRRAFPISVQWANTATSREEFTVVGLERN